MLKVTKNHLRLRDNREVHPVDFGAWVKRRLQQKGVRIAALSSATGIVYPTLNRMLNSGANGKPVKPEDDTVKRIADAMIGLGVIENEDEAWLAAAYEVEGYVTVPKERVRPEGETIPETVAVSAERARQLAAYNNAPPDVRAAVDRILDPFAAKSEQEEDAARQVEVMRNADKPDAR